MAVVTLERLSKRYEGASDLAVKEVSLAVKDGQEVRVGDALL